MDDCAAIVLAAGASTRLGRPKQLIQVEGESLLRRTTRLAADSGCSPVFAILGRDAESLRREVDGLQSIVVVNEEWASGMASSLKIGLKAALAADPQLANMMVLVCDQPNLNSHLLQELLATHRLKGAWITASRYRETLGVPAVFSKATFGELLELTGDQGARKILSRRVENIAAVPFPGGDFDLDTPEDLALLHSQLCQ